MIFKPILFSSLFLKSFYNTHRSFTNSKKTLSFYRVLSAKRSDFVLKLKKAKTTNP